MTRRLCRLRRASVSGGRACLQAVDEVDQLVLEMLAHGGFVQHLLAAFLRFKRALMKQQSSLADLSFQHAFGAVGVE